MVMITVPFIAAVLALSTSVSGAYLSEAELEARNPIVGAAGRTLGRMATGAVRNRVASSAPRIANKATGVTGKQMTLGLVGGKLFGGAVVGAGALGAQGVDNKISGRDIEELQGRNPTVLRGATRIAGQVGRSALRPQAVARPIARVSTPATGGGGVFGKLKGAGAVTGIGLAAGAGEYYGGKHMGNAIERLETKKRELEERDFELEDRDFDDYELWARNPALIRAATRVAGQAARSSRTTVGKAAANVGRHPSIGQKVGGIAGKVGMGAGIAGAAAAGGYVEGGIQNLTPETQQRLRQDPKGTIKKMLPPNAFGIKNREYVEELVTRAIIGMMLEEDME